jgi:hypothetical protein
MSTFSSLTANIKPIAQAGLIAKGLVYCLIGILAFMAAFHLGGQSTGNTDRQGALNLIEKQTGGKIMLAVIALGFFCFSLWRFVQTFADTENKGTKPKGIAERARFLFSGLMYTALGIGIVKTIFFSKRNSGGDSRQEMARELLSWPFGEWLLGVAAAIMVGIGIYQIYFGLSEKFRKHMTKAGGNTHVDLLVKAGKVGFVALGIVWLIIGWLFAKAAWYSNSTAAGDTSKAFRFLADASYGALLLGAVGLGLVCHGIFNFIRARYERFG